MVFGSFYSAIGGRFDGVLGFIVTEHFDDVFGKLLLNFSVSRNRLRNFRSWVLIPIMLTAMTNEDTTHFLKLLD